jgi:hypothetical protein
VTKIGVQVGKIVIKIIIKNYKLLEGRGGESGELSFQCLRPSTKPSTSLMAAGKNLLITENQ